VDLSESGLLATFDGPGRAVRAAGAVRDALAPVGGEVRAGVHTAEVARRADGGVGGLGVEVALRLAAEAEPGAVWVSRTVTDLVSGCGLVFEARGEHRLAGLPQPWAVYEAAV
jgi:class 3 adenylate cyclase